MSASRSRIEPKSDGKVSIRTYAGSDLPACLAVFDTNVPRYFRREERPEFEAFLRNLPGPYFVQVDAAGSVVGCGGYAVGQGTDVADLCWGMVRQDDHGQGLGRELTELRIAEVRADARVRSIALQTSHHTVAFYERLGFRTTKVIPNGYAPGLHRHDMVLELGGRA